MINEVIRRRPAGVVTLPAYVDHDKKALEKSATITSIENINLAPLEAQSSGIQVPSSRPIFTSIRHSAGAQGLRLLVVAKRASTAPKTIIGEMENTVLSLYWVEGGPGPDSASLSGGIGWLVEVLWW